MKATPSARIPRTPCGCLTLNVEVRRTGEPTGLDPDDGLRLTAHVARDVFTRLVLNAPNLGFPGALLNRERQTVTIDGQPAPIDHAKHHDPNSVTLLHDQVVSLGDLQIAVTGTRPPSRARTMVAEAGYQVLFNPNASKVTGVIVAASACEIAAHACVRRLARGHLERLTTHLIPPAKQAKVSPRAVIDNVPVLTGRRLADEDGSLWAALSKILAARDTAVHQGELEEGTNVLYLVSKARQFVEWVETLGDIEVGSKS